MAAQTELALATCVQSEPNVRIVNFYFEPKNDKLYFSTFKGNDKIVEMIENPNVAFSTIPHAGNAHVRARGIVFKSLLTIFDLAEYFSEKIPGYANTIQQFGTSLELFEIRFTSAIVTLDLAHIETIQL